MKKLLSVVLFGLVLSATVIAEVIKTEYITEETCLAISGCWINPKTGECPDCVKIKKTIVTRTKEKKIDRVVKTIKPKKVIRKTFTTKKKWVCVIGPCDWIDENGNLIEG
jgi:hypothetical protein